MAAGPVLGELSTALASMETSGPASGVHKRLETQRETREWDMRKRGNPDVSLNSKGD